MKTIILSTIFILFFVSSCDLVQQNEYYHLADSQRSLLKTGDQLVYIDSNSKTDTFSVFKKISGTYKSPLTGSNCGEPAMYFDLELLYLVNKEDLSDDYCRYLNGSTQFGACAKDYLCDKAILFSLKAPEGGKQTQSNYNQPALNWYGGALHAQDTFIGSMSVLNNSYDNVYYYESDFIHKSDSIRGIYYSCQYGIIQMDLMDGNVLKLLR